MKRSSYTLLSLCCAFALSPVGSQALAKPKGPGIGTSPGEVPRAIAVPKKRPDLAVVAIRTTKLCYVEVELQNRGEGSIPDAAYRSTGTGLSFLDGNEVQDRFTFKQIDPGRALREPEGSVKFLWDRTEFRVRGSKTVTVQLDPNDNVAEEPGANNVKREQLSCPASDWSLKTSFTSDCRSQVDVTYLGAKSIHTSEEKLKFRKVIDGSSAETFDLPYAAFENSRINPKRRFRVKSSAAFDWRAAVRYDLTGTVAGKRVRVKGKIARVPNRCASQRSAPDLAVKNIRLDSKCTVLFDLVNEGQGPLPDWVYSGNGTRGVAVAYKKADENWGGWVFSKPLDPDRNLKTPGGSFTWKQDSRKISGKEKITVTIDSHDHLAEATERNNSQTKTLTCRPSNRDSRRRPVRRRLRQR